MIPTLILLCILLAAAVVFLWYRNEEVKKRAGREVAAAQLALFKMQQTIEADMDVQRLSGEQALTEATRQFDERLNELKRHSESLRQHYEAEARRAEEAFTARLSQLLKELAAAQEAALEAQRGFEVERGSLRLRAEQALKDAARQLDEAFRELQNKSESLRQHYEAEARRAEEAITARLSQALDELETLRPFKDLLHAEQEVQQRASAAIEEADRLRQEAAALLDSAKAQGLQERTEARQRAKELQEHAEAMLTEATRESRRTTEAAEQRAIEIGGDAYRALREKEGLDRAVAALRNTIEGYGDRYIIPTRSLLDDLAADFGHTEAGVALRTARERSRLMVEHGEAATCDYVDPNRRATAIRFVIDAFNGRVDAILTRVKHDNFGTLEQEIRDAFSLVNLNGDAFRNAQILPSYLDARLAELKWAVVAQELKLKEREEQRRIQEQMREEERARREYEKALREAARDEENLRKAMELARAEIEKSSLEAGMNTQHRGLPDRLHVEPGQRRAKTLDARSDEQQIGTGGEDIERDQHA